jgi:predicted Fe-S protein YdhL (DUF1289 family)
MHSIHPEEEIQSPCIGVCTMSESTNLCLGCYRTIDEIRHWWEMSAGQKREVLALVEQRQIADASFD